VNGVEMYWEARGEGQPLVVVHGGYGMTTTFGGLLDELAGRRRVVAVELQGHGHTRDIDRPFSYEAFGDDIAALTGQLGLGPADLLGYSVGAGACLRTAIQHPDRTRRFACVSFPFRRDGWFPVVREAFDQMSRAGFEQLRHSPLYAAWSEVAPDRTAFPALMDKTGELHRRPYDWSEEVRQLAVPTLLVFADADSIPASHMAEFFALLGGGDKEPGWEGVQDRSASQLAVLPGRTHYDIVESPAFAGIVDDFFG
jgi:pimeloyl-ACP methyl ester carboxylesterase